MSDSKKSARGKPMNKAGAASKHEEPLLGEAALKEALAEFGVSPNALGGFGVASGAPSSNGGSAGTSSPQAEPPPKTVAQVLGEMT
jgi:cytolysin-activating lysine-acyltransferase